MSQRDIDHARSRVQRAIEAASAALRNEMHDADSAACKRLMYAVDDLRDAVEKLADLRVGQ